jgi:hypothetical protein
MNRFHHLKKILAPNLENLIPFGSVVEWVIVNYNSQDEMDEGLRDYASFISSGHLTYYRTTDFQYFNLSHAKNLSHVLAGGDYVMNLDADNFLDIDGISKMLRGFYQYPDALIQGYAGLVGLKKSHFLSLGGYDEDFHGWGHEDNDLIMRAKRLGLTHLQSDCLKGRIEHGDEERVENFDPALLEEFKAKDPLGIRREMNDRNWRMRMLKAQEGEIRANEKRIIGRASVTKNFSEEKIEVGWMTSSER